MHGPSLASILAAVIIGLVTPSSEVVDEARRRLALHEGASAAAILEQALPKAGGDRETILKLLREAYEAAAQQAETGGRARDAATYRENLKILNRKARTATPEPPPALRIEAPRPAESPAPLPVLPEPIVETNPEPIPEPSIPFPSTPEPAPVVAPPAEVPPIDLPAADAAFEAKSYLEASQGYGRLAKDRKLPENRREAWAYARASVVKDRINARPKTDAEWATIDAEIDQIRVLDPDNWVGEYLRNKASERFAGRKKSKPASSVVRASSPEEPALDRSARPVANTTPAVALASNSTSRTPVTAGRWQLKETPNFRIYHVDPKLADKVATAAEAVRTDQARRWSPAIPPRGSWTPSCEIYLYPTAKQYAQMTGQPEDSPGFSTMGMNAGRIISRRVNLRTDHPALLSAVLPHEVTHVVLADVFPVQQVPRWADEGLAVLSEPDDEQKRRAGDLNEPLTANRLFSIEALMSMDYPDTRFWSLYYAQSVSLTRFLVEQGTPAQMVQFLQGSQRNGFEAELRTVYRIDGYADLQRRWLAYARSMVAAQTAETTAIAPDLKVR